MTRWLHDRDPRMFAEAIRFTAAETGFIPRLIEKDYFCSVVLEELAALDSALIFKGGTLLAKVHSGFYRLSEDLDFSISTGPAATKKTRSNSVAPIKSAIASLPERLPGFAVDTPLTGSNGSTQYNAGLSYRSVLADQRETIKIEIGLREPVLSGSHRGLAQTLLMNPIRPSMKPVPGVAIVGLTYRETMAEKIRAALCRREVAIRDFFDIDHAVVVAQLDTLDPAMLDLVCRKIAVPGTAPIDVSPERRAQLAAQLGAELRPVLRTKDFERFDINRAFETVAKVAQAIVGQLLPRD